MRQGTDMGNGYWLHTAAQVLGVLVLLQRVLRGAKNMIPKHKIFRLRMNKSLKVRGPIDGDVKVDEWISTGIFRHNDNYIFLEIVADSIDEARAIFRDNKKEVVRYLWDTTSVNTLEDVVKFTDEVVGE